MGFATIIGGGEKGRYTITVDTGEATRQSLLAAVTTSISRLETRLAEATLKVAEADAAEAFLIDQIAALTDELIANINTPGQPPNLGPMLGARQVLADIQMRHFPLRIILNAVKADLAKARALAASVNNLQTLITKQAWCVDFTENGAVGAVVATADIPGDTNLQLIAPGCRGWTPADGQFIARELLSPPQAYLAAAIFPGWQKFQPTYRWGTITAINFETDTVNVDLFPQTSSAQRLGVNQSSSLANVPVDYMGGGTSVFLVDDRVVVQFQGQDWAAPKVIGFLDNPRPPGYWDALFFFVNTDASSPTGFSDFWGMGAQPGSPYERPYTFNAGVAGTLVAEYRKVPGGAWQPTDRYVSGSGLTVEFLMPGESSGTGEALFAISNGFAGLQDISCTVPYSIGVAAGDILETRLRVGSKVIFQSAFVINPVGPARIAITGRRRNDVASSYPGTRALTVLNYGLQP